MKVYILMGNPNADGTLTNAFADAYQAAAEAAGHEVRRANVGDLAFDPILHKGYRAIQELEPDLLTVQQDIKWCDHFVLLYPLWWSSAPSLLKGLVDRMWLPGFAFRFIKGPDGKSTLGWHKLLKGKTARVIVLLKNHPLLERFMYGDYTAEIANAVLGFSGFRVKITEIGNSEGLSESAKAGWMRKIAAFGRAAR
ncbi:MAG TPA: NAD(P)H-dependent oxidoreductase [Candidatus Paceibacterota bacterium]|nr:NAD(P)H-dependent oxidoreductase [Candidatus Paceibacterota bacterium]